MSRCLERLCTAVLAALVLTLHVPHLVLGQDAQVEDAGVRSTDAAIDAQLDVVPGPWMPLEQRGQAEVEPSTAARATKTKDREDDAGVGGDGGATQNRVGEVKPSRSEESVLSDTTDREESDSGVSASEVPEQTLVFQSDGAAQRDSDGGFGAASDLSDLVSVVVDEKHGPAAFWGWLVLALLAWLLDRTLLRREAGFTESGLLPSLQSISALLWRVALAMAVFFFVLRAVPAAWLPDLKWVVLGCILIAIWTMRGVLTDLVARVVIAIDGKVRPRLMIQTRDMTGRVARVGIRKTDVVDAIGRTWALPNRRLLSARVREPSETHVHASLTLDVPDKRVIEDAALASAWIHPNAVVHVWRDESDPNLWHVETELISHDFERVFRSDLAERVREYVRHTSRDAANAPSLAPRGPEASSDVPTGSGYP